MLKFLLRQIAFSKECFKKSKSVAVAIFYDDMRVHVSLHY